jgi:hypothetical protein
VDNPENVYNKWYKRYREEQFVTVLENSDSLINQFSGDVIVSKFELLKANTIGKLQGLQAYKKALQFVADNYSNSEEGKNAKEILKDQIPFLETMDFSTTDTHNWKILYKVSVLQDNSTKVLEEKIKKFLSGENSEKLTCSNDIYTAEENFITIHGIKSESSAKSISLLLKENENYKIGIPPIVLTNENYKVIQIKKNRDAYLALKNQ